MSSQLKPSERFKKNMLIFLDIICEMFQEGSQHSIVDSDSKLLTILKILINSTPGNHMIKNFIKKTNPYWNKIKERNIEYFKENGLEFFSTVKEKGLESVTEEDTQDNSFVKNLKNHHIDNFKKLLESSYLQDGVEVDILDDERKEDIWKILESFVKISISHIHEERDYIEGKYTQEYFPEINVQENAKEWNIKGIKF